MTRYAAIADETMERARQSGDQTGLCVAHMIFANLHIYTGKVAASARSAAEAARHYRSDAHSASFHLSGLDIGIHIPLGTMNERSFSGDHAEADEYMEEGLRRAEAQPQVAVLCFMNFWASFRCLIERDFERAGALADRAVAVANEHGVGIWATAGQLSQGAALMISDPDRAVALISAALVKLEAIPRRLFQPTYLCFQAEVLLRLGRIVEARGTCEHALAMSASSGLTWWDAELHRVRAAVTRAEGGGDGAAREALARALAIAEEQGSETFRRRAAADLAAPRRTLERLRTHDGQASITGAVVAEFPAG
jgi:hypothetical protein